MVCSALPCVPSGVVCGVARKESIDSVNLLVECATSLVVGIVKKNQRPLLRLARILFQALLFSISPSRLIRSLESASCGHQLMSTLNPNKRLPVLVRCCSNSASTRSDDFRMLCSKSWHEQSERIFEV
ncbi:hypothetical protein NPIL_191261 [Nephila pilipes]|uniref:Uncharacterized protein n=1 Tax=Nephila pilipes TaxID=299642 RepID=A0A8X6QC22_NEPPI|nr:hypothetical protein NPIL_191261 [Nephila pilipes]